MTATLRHMFSRLVSALIAEGEKEKALKALDYCMDVIPSKSVPHTYVCAVLASQYLQLANAESDPGKKAEIKEKGEVILNEMLENSLQYLNWFSTSLTPNQLRSATADFAQHLGIFSEILQIAQNFDNEELVEANYPEFMKYSQIYNSLR